jgi:hypothetical protein
MGDDTAAAALRTLLSVLFMSFPNNIATGVYKFVVVSSGNTTGKSIQELGIYLKIIFSFL